MQMNIDRIKLFLVTQKNVRLKILINHCVYMDAFSSAFRFIFFTELVRGEVTLYQNTCFSFYPFLEKWLSTFMSTAQREINEFLQGQLCELCMKMLSTLLDIFPNRRNSRGKFATSFDLNRIVFKWKSRGIVLHWSHPLENCATLTLCKYINQEKLLWSICVFAVRDM